MERKQKRIEYFYTKCIFKTDFNARMNNTSIIPMCFPEAKCKLINLNLTILHVNYIISALIITSSKWKLNEDLVSFGLSIIKNTNKINCKDDI